MDKEYNELVGLIKESDRGVLDEEWVKTELFAVKSSGMAGNFLRMKTKSKKSGKKYTNPNQSAIAYLLGITDYAPAGPPPVKAKTARIDPPDIDTDFEDRRREEIKAYVHKKWKNVSSIATILKFKDKGLVRDLGRVFAIPLSEINEVCKKFNNAEEFLHSDKTLDFRQKYPEIPEFLKKFEGRWRGTGMHAAGMVIANTELSNILPLESRKETKKDVRRRVTAYDMDDVATLGLIKFDFLGVSHVTVVHDTLKAINKDIDLDALPLDDSDVLKEFSLGHTVGIFQADTPSYTRLLKDMVVDSFEELMASNALVRPGPLTTVTPEWIARKHGTKQIEEIHPQYDEITKESYGVVIYQEQLMQLLVDIGGFTHSEADKVRKVISKKRDPEEFKPFMEKWLENAIDKVGKTRAQKLWKDFIQFAGYAFNKSHACAYSVLSYQTMWLKKYYPLEFLWALLNNEDEKSKITTFILEGNRLGIEFLPPNINKSKESFSIEDGKIRFGIKNILGLADAAAIEIIKKQPYESSLDFYARVDKRRCNKKVYDVLLKIDAFGEAEHNPKKFFYEYLAWPQDLDSESELKFPYLTISDLEDINESGLNLIKVLVKKVDRKPGWTKIEVEDVSSQRIFFGPDKIKISAGRMVLAVTWKSDFVGYTYLDEFENKVMDGGELDKFESFLMGKVFNGEEILYNNDIGHNFEDRTCLAMTLSLREFPVKKPGQNLGKLMARTVLTNGEYTKEFVIFPSVYATLRGQLKPWEPVAIKPEVTKDGNDCINMRGLKLAKDIMLTKGLL